MVRKILFLVLALVLLLSIPGTGLVERAAKVALLGDSGRWMVSLSGTDGGSSASWPMFRHDPAHTGSSSSSAPSTNRTDWIYTGTGSTLFSSPAVANGRVFIRFYEYSYGRVHAINETTGTFLWHSSSEWLYGRTFSPAVWNGRVYVVSGAYGVILNALNESTGEVLWSYSENYAITTSPTIANGKVFFVENSGIYVRALNATTGEKLWEYLQFTPEQGVITATPAVADGIVVYGTSNNLTIALDESTGGYLWSYSTSGRVVSSPTIANGRVFVGSEDAKIYALNESTGALIWNYTTGGIVNSSPAFADGRVYVGSDDNQIYCLNQSTGELVWNYTTGDMIRSSPAVAEGKVYVGSHDNRVYCLNATTGARIWSYTTGGDVWSSPAVADGKVFVGSADGNVYCFARDTAPPVITITSPENTTYCTTSVPLTFTVNETTDWIGYSLDNTPNMTITGNTTLSGLGDGAHNVIVYANDTMGNMGSSDKVYFTVCMHAYLVVRGLDDRIYYRVYNSSSDSWESWDVVPVGATCDRPAAAVCCGRLHIVVRGMDGYSLWYGWINLTDNSFSEWTRLSGSAPSAPTLTSNGTALYLVVRGFNNRIYFRSYDCVSETWEEWNAVTTGATCDSPAAAMVGGSLHVVVRGMDEYSLWHGYLTDPADPGSFSGWTRLSGSTPSAPTLASDGTVLSLVVRGFNDRIYYRIYEGSWGGWNVSPGATCDSPAAAMLGNDLHIVVRGMDEYSLWHGYLTNPADLGSFSGWSRLSGATPSAPTLTS